jgi:pheromone alpha factor receptor
MNLPPNFDPFTQNFTVYNGDGEQFVLNMGDIDYLRMYGIRLAINYATQIGASIILLLVLIILTKREKRRSGVFIMNALCLFVNVIRSILQCCYLTSSFWNFYSQLTYDTSHDTWASRANTIASNTMTLLLVICVMISLSMQAWVVCITTPMVQRIIIFGITTTLALIAVGYRFAVTVISNIKTMQDGDMLAYQHLVNMNNIFQAIAIWSYCAVFTFKLGYAILQRKKLGLTQFGPMQIIFIMGAQTMVIPGMSTITTCPHL